MAEPIGDHLGMEALTKHFRGRRVAQRMRTEAAQAGVDGTLSEVAREVTGIPRASGAVSEDQIVIDPGLAGA